MSLQERPYPYVVASSEKYRVVKRAENKYTIDRWDDDRVDSMGKMLSSEWRTMKIIDLGTDGGRCDDDYLRPYIEIMENGWATSGVQQP